ncbi:GntR family transcriptional regulator [Rhizobium laguerreae]|uniref:GntR family transcriptional regulator n=1 Tax=Rhizobium laguerreae TaxID=1076926 RepID=UPI001ECFC1D1|nr:GntR family transcriptional regulator [Rhizobium laguerreae]MBY3238292.1 GntR family transcriptional regulator [Rhizobium laguerreae]
MAFDDDGVRAGAGTLSDELRNRLEEMIVSGLLKPGERLDEVELAARFKVSRTPVREALKALSATGLVDIRGRQGITVAIISIPILLEMFQMMAALEGLCAKLAARRATVVEKAALREIHGRLINALSTSDPDNFYAINSEFHELLYDAAHTHFLAGQTRALRRRVAAYRRYVTYQPGRMAATIGEHERILDAIERADAETAFKAASEHVNLLGDDMADFIAALPAALVQEA